MIKQTIKYKDFDDVEQTEEMSFHISKTDVTKDLEMADEFKAVGKELELKEDGDTLTVPEITRILELVKKLVKMSYGVRSTTPEGRQKFVKNDQVWEDFRYSAAYDAFLFGMFEDVPKAVAFMTGVFPKELLEAAQEEQAAQKAAGGPKLPQDYQQKQVAAPKPEITISEPETVPFEEPAADNSDDLVMSLEAQLAAAKAATKEAAFRE